MPKQAFGVPLARHAVNYRQWWAVGTTLMSKYSAYLGEKDANGQQAYSSGISRSLGATEAKTKLGTVQGRL